MHDDQKKRFRKQRSVKPGGPVAKAGPTLREFWAELQRAKAAGEPLPAAPSASRAADGGATPHVSASRSSGSFRSSGSYRSSSSGSGGAGYGLALIASDPVSQERIRRIMRSLCEKDAERGR